MPDRSERIHIAKGYCHPDSFHLKYVSGSEAARIQSAGDMAGSRQKRKVPRQLPRNFISRLYVARKEIYFNPISSHVSVGSGRPLNVVLSLTTLSECVQLSSCMT